MNALLTIALLALQAAPQASRVQMGVVVQPETVTVGDPFRLIIRVRAPRSAVIEFPTAMDSGGVVEALDPVVVQPSSDTTIMEQTATYRLAAWDVGRLPLALADILVRDADGERRVPLRNIFVQVRSVLPSDSAQRTPKPPRDIIDIPPPWWWWVILGLAALALLLLIWAWLRRRRRLATVQAIDPLELAEESFNRIDKLGLVAAGERARHAALVIEVVREYLAGTVPYAPTSLTSAELLAALREEAGIPTNALATVLVEVDLVKFARRPITAERALALGKEARAMVRAIDTARHATPVVVQEAA
ncbi:MAG: hypothetical protein ABI877_00275 [Gemmatimonadaceae bacterium]